MHGPMYIKSILNSEQKQHTLRLNKLGNLIRMWNEDLIIKLVSEVNEKNIHIKVCVIRDLD